MEKVGRQENPKIRYAHSQRQTALLFAFLFCCAISQIVGPFAFGKIHFRKSNLFLAKSAAFPSRIFILKFE
jgi:hypothetical protein